MKDLFRSGGIKPIGSHVYFPSNEEILKFPDGQEYLRSGHILENEQDNYPESYEKFGTNGTGRDFSNWIEVEHDRGIAFVEIAYGNGVYVGVGQNGKIFTSTDEKNWTECASPTTRHLTGVAYGNNTFVAVGNYATVLVSTNGVEWTAIPGVSSDDLYMVVFGDGKFVTAGWAWEIFTSTDGIYWEGGRVKEGSGGLWCGIYDGSRFLVAGSEGALFVSADGDTWSEGEIPLATTYGLDYLGGLYVAVGGASGHSRFYTSVDSVTWQVRNIPVGDQLGRTYYKTAYDNGRYIIAGTRGTVVSTTDFAEWDILKNLNGLTGTLRYLYVRNGVYEIHLTTSILKNIPDQLLGLQTEEFQGDAVKYMRIK